MLTRPRQDCGRGRALEAGQGLMVVHEGFGGLDLGVEEIAPGIEDVVQVLHSLLETQSVGLEGCAGGREHLVGQRGPSAVARDQGVIELGDRLAPDGFSGTPLRLDPGLVSARPEDVPFLSAQDR